MMLSPDEIRHLLAIYYTEPKDKDLDLLSVHQLKTMIKLRDSNLIFHKKDKFITTIDGINLLLTEGKLKAGEPNAN